MCHVLSVKKSRDFSWTQVDPLQKDQAVHKDDQLIETAFFDLKENAGTRGIKGDLLHENDVRISRRKIGKILATLGLKVKTQKKFKKQSTAPVSDPRIMPNILKRHFDVSYPNQVWVGDMTEIKTCQGKLYLAAYIDLYSRRIIGFATAPHMRSELTELALQRALWSRKPSKGLIVQTDQGSQFIRDDYRKLLKAWDLKQSMS